jgi:haloalkane dehalogenase
MTEKISAAFPYESRFVTVKGSQMHYVEQGQGDPILFVHGNPTSSYLWRNVIPLLTGSGRCIALDLIGMGLSDKPDIPYRLFDHVEYFDGFINELGLGQITLVVHDWGGFLGMHYASDGGRRQTNAMDGSLRGVPRSVQKVPERRGLGNDRQEKHVR